MLITTSLRMAHVATALCQPRRAPERSWKRGGTSSSRSGAARLETHTRASNARTDSYLRWRRARSRKRVNLYAYVTCDVSFCLFFPFFSSVIDVCIRSNEWFRIRLLAETWPIKLPRLYRPAGLSLQWHSLFSSRDSVHTSHSCDVCLNRPKLSRHCDPFWRIGKIVSHVEEEERC